MIRGGQNGRSGRVKGPAAEIGLKKVHFQLANYIHMVAFAVFTPTLTILYIHTFFQGDHGEQSHQKLI